MREGPDISVVAALIGNPACANMLMALLAGPALTATELAQEAGLSLSTVSGHLDRLQKAALLAVERQGRHRYFHLADPDVAHALEALMPVATRAGHVRVRTGPRDPELRRARSCYDHLAGDLAVKMFDRFVERRLLARRGDEVHVTRDGAKFFARAGIDLGALQRRQAVVPALSRLERAAQPSRRRAWCRDPRSRRRAALGGARSEVARRAVLAGGRAEIESLVVALITSHRAAAYRARPAGRRIPRWCGPRTTNCAPSAPILWRG